MRVAGLGLLLMLMACSAEAAPPPSAEFKRRQQEMKLRHEQHKAEMQRKHAQAVQKLKADGQRQQTQIRTQVERLRAASTPSASLPPFDPRTAPPPAECLWAYVNAAKTATSMEPLLRFLPVDEARALTEEQKAWNPKQAARRLEERKNNPYLPKEPPDFMTLPPYDYKLKRIKERMNNILEVLSVTTEGSKSIISVSTNCGGTFNGVHYPYSTAKIEMIGEAGYWKLKSYNDSITNYLYQPRPRQ